MHFSSNIYFISWASVGGREESFSPHRKGFDFFHDADSFGESTFEKGESELSRLCLNFALNKSKLSPKNLELLVAGDLQNQCVASSYGLYSFGIPYFPLYGACSTCTEALLAASMYLECVAKSAGHHVAAAVTSSHNSAAERQFRTPLEYGAERAPTAQWTATAGGAFILGCGTIPADAYARTFPFAVSVRMGMAGKMIDGAITDASNMGPAMAPAARDTICRFFKNEDIAPSELDAIITGDLGEVGSQLLISLLEQDNIKIGQIHKDCGCMLYDKESQDFHSGASGCGASASLLGALILPKLASGEWRRVLFLSTGALMSPTSVLQGINIFGIAPLVVLESKPISSLL